MKAPTLLLYVDIVFGLQQICRTSLGMVYWLGPQPHRP